MSWCFGVIGPDVCSKNVLRYQTVHGVHLHQNVKENSYYFACGGNINTCFTGNNSIDDSFWIGLGVIVRNETAKDYIQNQTDWNNIAHNNALFEKINGQYVLLTYKDNTFEIRTDTLGLRTIYWCQKGKEIIVSTRIDWIAKYFEGLEIDYTSIGSRWLMFNQLSYHSLVKGTHRLGPNGRLKIENNRISCSDQSYTPRISKDTSLQESIECLQALVLPFFNGPKQITLGLSGGLDSRVLLSLILKSKNSNFQTHTFGDIHNPDIFIPKLISEREHFKNYTYNTTLSSSQDLIPILQTYAAETNLIEPISTALRLNNNSCLDPNKFVLVDGGFGEIARRQYMNRMAIHGRMPFQDHNIALILKSLRVQRGNIFTAEINRQMEEGVHNEISNMLNTMPDLNEIGLENYLDLWSIRTRIPNFGSDEQARLDKQIVNYMPFAQVSFVDSVFTMPISMRKNGTLFRKIIKTSYPSLRKYPLVKNGTTYPFLLSTKSSWIYTKIKSKIGYTYSENPLDPFLESMKEYIFDTLLSKNVKEYPAYDYQNIHNSIIDYYNGNQSSKNEILWWLTFDLWRKTIEHK